MEKRAKTFLVFVQADVKFYDIWSFPLLSDGLDSQCRSDYENEDADLEILKHRAYFYPFYKSCAVM